MSNEQHIRGILRALEKQHTAKMVYPYFSAFYDVVVLGHTSSRDDNPHEPYEQPSYDLYRNGAVAAEKLMRDLSRVQLETQMLGEEHWRN